MRWCPTCPVWNPQKPGWFVSPSVWQAVVGEIHFQNWSKELKNFMADKKTDDFLIRDRQLEWDGLCGLWRFFWIKKCQGARHYHGQSNENLSFSVLLALVIYSNWWSSSWPPVLLQFGSRHGNNIAWLNSTIEPPAADLFPLVVLQRQACCWNMCNA